MASSARGGGAAGGDDLFRSAMAASSIGLSIAAPDGRFVEVNPALCRFFGRDADDLLARTWQELTHPDDLAEDLSWSHRMLAGEIDSYRLSKRYLHADGSTLYGDVVISAIRAADGRMRFSICQIVDQADRRRAEDELRASEERYRLLAENAADVVYVSDDAGTVRWISGSITRLTGWAPEEIVGRPSIGFVHPDDRSAVRAVRRRIRRGDAPVGQLRVRTSDGRHRWMEIRLRPVHGADGNVTGWVGAGRDIEAEVEAREAFRESETRFATLVAGLPVGVYVGRTRADGSVRFDYVSPRRGEILGADAAAALRDPRVIFANVHPADLPGLQEALVEDWRARRGLRWEGRIVVDGKERFIRVISVRVDMAGEELMARGIVEDVTETHVALEAVRARDARHAAILGSAVDAIITARDDGTIVEWNPAATRIFGWTEAEALGRSVSLIQPQAVTANHADALRRFRESAERSIVGRTIELTGRRRDGTIFPLELSLSEWSGPDGHFATVIIRDGTERARAEEALRRLATAVEATDESIVITDVGASIVYANAAFERVTGYAREEALGQNPRILQSGRQSAAFYAAMWADLTEGRTWRGRLVNRRRDGSLYVEDATITPVRDADGAVSHYVAVKRDITGRIEAEAALARTRAELVEAQRIAHVGSWTMDRATSTAEWSREQYRIFGLDPALPAPSMDELLLLLTPESAARLRASIEEGFPGGPGVDRIVEMPLEVVRPDGSIRQVIHRAEAIRDASGALVGVRGTHTDVTAQRELEASLAEAARLEAVGRLAGGVAHMFNNALMVINGTAEMLRDSLPDGDERREDVDSIIDAGSRAADVAKKLLAFGRRQTLRPTAVDLGDLVADVAPLLRQALGSDVKVRLDVGPDAPTVLVDRGQLEQMLVTLALNARDAMPDGGTVTLAADAINVDPVLASAHPGVRPGRFGRLSVSDTGEGMGPSAIPHLFEPFYGGKDLASPAGLGLAAIQGIVLQSGGWIEVDSVPGSGSRFSILLPLATGRPVAPTAGSAGGDAADGADTGAQVLLVEDEEDVRRGIARMLGTLGYAVVQADGPATALAMDDEALGRIDLLVSDVVMPGMHGGEMAHRIRARRPGLPVLFVSGYAPDGTLQEHLSEDSVAYLAKPFTRDAIDSALRRLRAEDR